MVAQEAIRQFIAAAFRGTTPGDDEDIFQRGHVNSLFAMELVTFLEGNFNITIENDDLDLENFSTVNRLAGLVERKRGGGPALS